MFPHGFPIDQLEQMTPRFTELLEENANGADITALIFESSFLWRPLAQEKHWTPHLTLRNTYWSKSSYYISSR